MTKAWVNNGVVLDVCRGGDPADCYTPQVAQYFVTDVPEHAENGDLWDGTTLTKPPPPKIMSVTMRQARLALLGAGLLDDVEAAINAMSEPAKTAARIEWDYSSELQRSHPLVAQLGGALGLDDAALDSLFITAAGL